MKLQKLTFITVILFIVVQACFAQEKPKAVLILEFDKTNCDPIGLQLDELFIRVSETPNSKGYILMNGGIKDGALEKYFWEIQMKMRTRLRQFDINRLVFLEGKDMEISRTQFWMVPENADRPALTEEKWDYKLPPNTKPFMAYSDPWLGEACFASFDVNFYAKFLLASRDLKGHIVIHGKSTEKFHQMRNKLLNQLVVTHKVRHRQLKFFYVKDKTSDVEYWFVPKRTT